MIYAVFILALLYGYTVFLLGKGIDRLQEITPDLGEPSTNFSIVVPFRNEAANLTALLESFDSLDYPREKCEFLLVNDASTDESEAIINAFIQNHTTLNINILQHQKKSKSPKKEAITKAIQIAAHQWILTTDADCRVPKTWLRAFDSMIRKQHWHMIAAPVVYQSAPGFLQAFQALDFLSLQGTTMGLFGMKHIGFVQPFLCNGANLCFSKESFKEVNGFQGNLHLPSGDDVFLLQKMVKKYPETTTFIKSRAAIVSTSAKKTWAALLEQRIRWAGKTTAYNSLFAKLLGLLIFMYNLSLVALLLLCVSGEAPWMALGFLFLVKFNIDFFLLYKTARFFEQTKVIKSYFTSSLVYPFYAVLVALLSLKKSYTWKGRSY